MRPEPSIVRKAYNNKLSSPYDDPSRLLEWDFYMWHTRLVLWTMRKGAHTSRTIPDHRGQQIERAVNSIFDITLYYVYFFILQQHIK